MNISDKREMFENELHQDKQFITESEIDFATDVSINHDIKTCSNLKTKCNEFLSEEMDIQNEAMSFPNKNLSNTYNQSSQSVDSLFTECSETLSLDEKYFPIVNEKQTFLEKDSGKCNESFTVEEKALPMTKIHFANGITEDGTVKKHLYKGLSKHASHRKLIEILDALENNDIICLKNAALSAGGLLNDDIRRKVWPKLVGVDLVAASPRPCQQKIEQHPYYDQVVLDVNRSLKRFPPSIQEAQRLTMLDQLVLLIMRVLCKHPELHYYQGYHDICVTFLLVLGEETAFHVIEKLSLTHLKVFMEKSMEPTIHLLEHIYLLIGKRNPQFKEFLMKSEVGVAYCLSWLITWFSHVLNDYSTVVRFFDFFIVSHPWMPIYLTATLVAYREKGVMKQDCDMASVHSFLCKIPDDLPFENLIIESQDLLKNYKPNHLAKERPYIRTNKRRKIKRVSFIQKIKFVPTTLVIAAAVLVTAVIYQAYNY